MLAGKKILLGITGGIAAYKIPWLVRDLKKAGAEVRVVMTPSAAEFVTPVVLSTLSQAEVLTSLWPPEAGGSITASTGHIDLALWADMMVIAPASANTVAKISNGIADNALTTLVLALRCPLAIAPSMDVDMYGNDATQHNISVLRERGVHVLDPDSGALASGLEGPGRLPELDILLRFIEGILDKTGQHLRGKKILVTAGPTHEPIDPVRFIGNRSSGKMGFAIANAAAQRGGDVTLVSGPVSLGTPRNVRRFDVQTAEEMASAVRTRAGEQDAVIMAAAIADFTPVEPAKHKIKKEAMTTESMAIRVQRTPDILAELGSAQRRFVLAGFALETDNDLANAKAKLRAKNLDLLILNNPLVEGAAFGSDTNVVTILDSLGRVQPLERMPKFDVACAILDRIACAFTEKAPQE